MSRFTFRIETLEEVVATINEETKKRRRPLKNRELFNIFYRHGEPSELLSEVSDCDGFVSWQMPIVTPMSDGRTLRGTRSLVEMNGQFYLEKKTYKKGETVAAATLRKLGGYSAEHVKTLLIPNGYVNMSRVNNRTMLEVLRPIPPLAALEK